MIICPSNPYLSVDPILAVSDIRNALDAVQAPIVAVSPLIGGQAVKGPTAKIMAELGLPADSVTIARHYPFLSGLIIDQTDQGEADKIEYAGACDLDLDAKPRRPGSAGCRMPGVRVRPVRC